VPCSQVSSLSLLPKQTEFLQLNLLGLGATRPYQVFWARQHGLCWERHQEVCCVKSLKHSWNVYQISMKSQPHTQVPPILANSLHKFKECLSLLWETHPEFPWQLPAIYHQPLHFHSVVMNIFKVRLLSVFRHSTNEFARWCRSVYSPTEE
jgi:hypothetical protein